MSLKGAALEQVLNNGQKGREAHWLSWLPSPRWTSWGFRQLMSLRALHPFLEFYAVFYYLFVLGILKFELKLHLLLCSQMSKSPECIISCQNAWRTFWTFLTSPVMPHFYSWLRDFYLPKWLPSDRLTQLRLTPKFPRNWGLSPSLLS